MAAYRLEAKQAWKKVPFPFDAENSAEFTGLGSFEVLEDYDLISMNSDERDTTLKTKKKLKTVPSKGVSESVSADKPSLKRKTSPSPDEEVIETKGETAEPAKKKRKPKKRKKKPASDNDNDKCMNVDNDKCMNDEEPTDRTSEKKKSGPAKKKRKRTKKPAKNSDGSRNVPTTNIEEKGDSEVTTPDEEIDMSAWKDLFVPDAVLKSLADQHFTSPSLIQALTLPSAIRDRLDILGAAETGSGKTLAFAIPVIHRILTLKEDDDNPYKGNVYALILTPTRELCVQVRDHIVRATKYTDIQTIAIFGGLSAQKQIRLLKKRPEIIVATPGRLWDIMQEGDDHLVTVKKTPVLVIDEADKMVEKGHFEELSKLLLLMKEDEVSCENRQSFVFSATLTFVHNQPDRLKTKKKRKKIITNDKTSKINELIETVGILKKPKIVDITSDTKTAGKLVESCILCTQKEKDLYLYYFLKSYPGRTLIFTNSIDCIRRLMSLLTLLQREVSPLHANMHQKQRLKNLERFASCKNGVLLASDVAARGLDIPNVDHVIHYQVPRTSENYVHRSGRTARANKDGISVMIVDEKDMKNYKKIVNTLEKADDLKLFPVDQTDLSKVKPLVTLAQELDARQHRVSKAKNHDDWFTKMAKEAEIILTDDDSDIEDQSNQAKLTERRRLDGMKTQLVSMLRGNDNETKEFRGKYPTSTGRLVLPKKTKLEDSAIQNMKNRKKIGKVKIHK